MGAGIEFYHDFYVSDPPHTRRFLMTYPDAAPFLHEAEALARAVLDELGISS